jgi:hypothetical protein
MQMLWLHRCNFKNRRSRTGTRAAVLKYRCIFEKKEFAYIHTGMIHVAMFFGLVCAVIITSYVRNLY